MTGLGFGVNPAGPHNDGCFMACFKVDAFRDLATFRSEVTEFAAYLKETPVAEGCDEVGAIFAVRPEEVTSETARRRSPVVATNVCWPRDRKHFGELPSETLHQVARAR